MQGIIKDGNNSLEYTVLFNQFQGNGEGSANTVTINYTATENFNYVMHVTTSQGDDRGSNSITFTSLPEDVTVIQHKAGWDTTKGYTYYGKIKAGEKIIGTAYGRFDYPHPCGLASIVLLKIK